MRNTKTLNKNGKGCRKVGRKKGEKDEIKEKDIEKGRRSE